ncbi:MAG: hypothetical protein V1875_05615 [Candidatus Altiarchaeota archaeon]
MLFDKEFIEEANRLIALDDRLLELLRKGKIKKGEYDNDFEAINRRLERLKVDNLRLIGQSLGSIGKASFALQNKKNAKQIGETEYLDIKHELVLKKNDLESERDAIELSHGAEYLACLRRRVQEKKYEHLRIVRFDVNRIIKMFPPRKATFAPPKAMIQAAGGNLPPLGAWAVAGAFVSAALWYGMRYMDESVAYFPAAAVVFAIVFWSALLHASTRIVGLQGASYRRAFRCAMMDWALKTACAVLSVAAYALAFRGEFFPAASGSDPLLSRAFVFLSGIAAMALSPIYSVYASYDANIRQSALTVLMEYALLLIMGVAAKTVITYVIVGF